MAGSTHLDLDELWDFDQPQATEQKFRDLLPEVRDSGDVTTTCELLTQIARAQGLQGHFEAAHNTLHEAEALLPQSAPLAHARYLLERGRVFNTSGDRRSARRLFLEAWEFSREHGLDVFAVDAAHMLGIIEPPDEQERWNLEAIRIAEASGDHRVRRWLCSLYYNLGLTYHDAGRYDEALELFRRALACHQEVGQIRRARIARWAVGRALRSLERYDEALAVQEALLVELDAINVTDGYVYEEIGECLLALGRPDEARPFFKRAYDALSNVEWLVQQTPERLARLHALGVDED